MSVDAANGEALAGTAAAPPSARPGRPFRIYYGWIMVLVAALAMVATFPGRTHGLGIITERLLKDENLGLTQVVYGRINLFATLAGALFCLGIGSLIDRYGVRALLTVVLLGLGVSVLAMNAAAGALGLFLAVMFTRGFGQSALSVVSLTIVGKWFQRRLNWAMAVYTVLMGVGFTMAFIEAGKFAEADWRTVWGGIGVILLASAPLAWLVTRNSPESCGLALDGGYVPLPVDKAAPQELGFTLSEALATPAFWVFALATSLFGLISSGVSLFNQSILAERGFPADTYYKAMAIGMSVGMVSNLGAGALMVRGSIARLTSGALVLLAGALVGLTMLKTFQHVVLWTVVNAVAGGVITVVFFTVWASLYGRRHLGKIQGAAQMLTVFASAAGPLLLAEGRERSGSYVPVLVGLAIVTALLGLVAWWVPLPARPIPVIVEEPRIAET